MANRNDNGTGTAGGAGNDVPRNRRIVHTHIHIGQTIAEEQETARRTGIGADAVLDKSKEDLPIHTALKSSKQQDGGTHTDEPWNNRSTIVKLLIQRGLEYATGARPAISDLGTVEAGDKDDGETIPPVVYGLSNNTHYSHNDTPRRANNFSMSQTCGGLYVKDSSNVNVIDHALCILDDTDYFACNDEERKKCLTVVLQYAHAFMFVDLDDCGSDCDCDCDEVENQGEDEGANENDSRRNDAGANSSNLKDDGGNTIIPNHDDGNENQSNSADERSEHEIAFLITKQMKKHLNLQMPLLHAGIGVVSVDTIKKIILKYQINVTDELQYDSDQIQLLERERLQERQLLQFRHSAPFHLQQYGNCDRQVGELWQQYPPKQQLVSPYDYHYDCSKERQGKNVLFTLLKVFSPKTKPQNGATYCQQSIYKKRERDSILEHELLRQFLRTNGVQLNINNNNNNNNNNPQQFQQRGANVDQQNDNQNQPIPPAGAEAAGNLNNDAVPVDFVDAAHAQNQGDAVANADDNRQNNDPAGMPHVLPRPGHRLMPLLRRHLNNNFHFRHHLRATRYTLRRLREAADLARNNGHDNDDHGLIDQLLQQEIEDLLAGIPDDLRVLIEVDLHEQQQDENQNNNDVDMNNNNNNNDDDRNNLPERLREHLEREVIFRIYRLNERRRLLRARAQPAGHGGRAAVARARGLIEIAQFDEEMDEIDRFERLRHLGRAGIFEGARPRPWRERAVGAGDVDFDEEMDEIDRFERPRHQRRAEMILENDGQGGGTNNDTANGNAAVGIDDDDDRRNDIFDNQQQQLRDVEREYFKALLDIFLAPETKEVSRQQRSLSQYDLGNHSNDVENQAPGTFSILPHGSRSESLLCTRTPLPLSNTRIPLDHHNPVLRTFSAPSMLRFPPPTPTTITINCAQIKDRNGRLPLHLAIEGGMTLDDLQDIILANMNALLEPDGLTGFYPFTLARDDINASYSLLLQNPAVMENVVKAMSG